MADEHDQHDDTVPDDASTLLAFTRDGVGHIRFNRPQRLNALTAMQHRRVTDAVLAADADPQVRAIAISGVGRAFCAGDDIAGGRRAWPADRRHRLVHTDAGPGPVLLQEVTTAIRSVGKPTVAVMHGYAFGGGYDYATSCDFRVATADCRLGDQRVLRAMWAGEGWTYKTPRLIGLARTMELGLFARILTGTQAYDTGFVHEVLPDADVDPLAAAAGFLDRLVALDPQAYRRQKHRLLALLDLPARVLDGE